MAIVSASTLLKENILAKEIELKREGLELKEDFKIVYESLKPVNIIKNSLKNVFQFGETQNNLVASLLGIVSTIIEQKINSSESDKPLKRILNSILRIFIAGAVAKNPDGIKSVGNQIIDTLFSKKGTDTDNTS